MISNEIRESRNQLFLSIMSCFDERTQEEPFCPYLIINKMKRCIGNNARMTSVPFCHYEFSYRCIERY
jgi:hypothetical protein